MPLKLSVIADRGSAGGAFVPYLRRHLRRAHKILDPPLRQMTVVLVNDRQMSELHERFMNIAGPTDVLTFPIEFDARARPSRAARCATAGEVAVCVPEARRRAREHDVDVKNELLLYALHGMLHLSGFDDRTDRGFARMHRAEDMILTQLGVGPVFHPSGSSRRRAAT